MKKATSVSLVSALLLAIGCGGGSSSNNGGSNNGGSNNSGPSQGISGSYEFVATSNATSGSTTLIEAKLSANGAQSSASGPSQVQTATHLNGTWYVNGVCSSSSPGQNSIAGTVSGTSITLTFNEGGNTFTGQGTVSGNSVSGTYSGTNSNCSDSGTFTGTQVPNLAGTFSGTLNFPSGSDQVTATLTEGNNHSLAVQTILVGADNGIFTFSGSAVANVMFVSGSVNGNPFSLFGYFDSSGTYTGTPNSIQVFDDNLVGGVYANYGLLVKTSQSPGDVTALKISPATSNIATNGGTATFTALATVTGLNAPVDVSSTATWALSDPTNFTITLGDPVTITAGAAAPVGEQVTITATYVSTNTFNATAKLTVASGGTANVVPISVNGGPLVNANPPSIYANGAFVSVQICAPSGACQTIPDVLVDTGSVGLRLLGSQVTVPLVPLNDGSGNTLYNCVQFLDNSFLWGAVAPATIVLGGETATSTSVQVIANPSFTIPGGCTGTNEDTQQLLGANGILGVGPEPFDCGLACDPSVGGTPPAVYYLCSSGGTCNTTFVSCGTLCNDSLANQQVTNPVFNFPVDNNGVILELPAVTDVAPTVTGSLIFGIGTQSNNALPSTATVLNLSSDNFTTNFGGQALTMSFIDSGSNGLFFPQINASPTICTDNTTWYCPASTTPLSATNVGASGSPSNTVNFSVDNFDNVTSANPSDAAFSNIAGPQGNGGGCSSSNTPACIFDWGLPFFYGRNVFTAIDGTTVGTTPTPFFAY
jgi:hypothetical protein